MCIENIAEGAHLCRPSQATPEGKGHQSAAQQATDCTLNCLLWAYADQLCAAHSLAKRVSTSISGNGAGYSHEGGNEANSPMRDASKQHLQTAQGLRFSQLNLFMQNSSINNYLWASCMTCMEWV